MKELHKKDDSDILFYRIRDVAVQFSHDDPEYIEWLRAMSPNGTTFHHVCGSVGPRKSTDLLGVMVSASEHSEKQRDRSWQIEQVPKAIENLIRYVKSLKERVGWLEQRVKYLENIPK